MKINDFCGVIFFAKCHLSFIAISHSVVDEFALRSKASPKPSPSLEFEGYQVQERPGTYDLVDSKFIFREIFLVAGDHEAHCAARAQAIAAGLHCPRARSWPIRGHSYL